MMVSARGVVLTGVMLAAVTGASFAAWLVPQASQDGAATFVITDYGGHLDGVRSIHEVLQESLRAEYEMMLDGSITPGAYDAAAGGTSAQVTAEIAGLLTSAPPEEWRGSYAAYIESLRSFNSHIVETRAVSAAVAAGSDASANMQRAEELRAGSAEHARISGESRP